MASNGMTSLEDLRDGWDRAARADAMGHILTTGQPWDRAAFFEHGRTEITDALAHLDAHGLRGKRRKRALDFGCGIGRVTQALALEYEHVDGVDIAQAMIDRARVENGYPERVRYAVRENLSFVRTGTYDLVYSMLTLQHMPQDLAHGYIHEFIRILNRNGIAVFNIPEGPDLPHPEPCLSMWGTPRATVVDVVKGAGGEVIDVQALGEHPTWIPYRYTARREARRSGPPG